MGAGTPRHVHDYTYTRIAYYRAKARGGALWLTSASVDHRREVAVAPETPLSRCSSRRALNLELEGDAARRCSSELILCLIGELIVLDTVSKICTNFQRLVTVDLCKRQRT